MSDYRDINSLNTTPTALITGGDKVPFYNTGDAYAYAMTLDQLQSWVLSGGTIDPTFDDVTCDTLVTTGNVGIGVTPSAWAATRIAIDVGTYASFATWNNATGSVNNAFLGAASTWFYKNTAAASLYFQVSGSHVWQTAASGTAGNAVTFSDVMRLDASGNLGLGVTPSAWSASFKALQVSTASLWSSGGSNALIGANYYHDGTNRRYISTAAATEYGQSGGSHIWYTAPSGTAGNAITFTQAATLDASSNFSAGTTSIASSGQSNGITAGSVLAVKGVLNAHTTSAGILEHNTSNNITALRSYGSTSGTGGIAFNTGGGGGSADTERVRVKSGGQVRFVPLTSAPTTNVEDGDVYYDSGTNKLRVRAGGAWVDLH